MASPILPGSTVGVLGSGQLGRMLALAARRMGYRVQTLSPDADSPTGQVADREWVASYHDLGAVREFAAAVDIVTHEFENVPAEAALAAAERVAVRPAGRVLAIAQNRLREKRWLVDNGFPTPAFARIANESAVAEALAEVGLPAVVKTAGFGYDGKGQRRVETEAEAIAAHRELGGGECVVERWVDFARELSVVGARGLGGEFAAFGPMENRHERQILDVSLCPARVAGGLARDAVELTRRILERLEVHGVLCVELFLSRDGVLLVNELAPRPHNSGHLTIEAHETSQFEQQLRAVCGLPLGSTRQRWPAAMANVLGDLWWPASPEAAPREPHWAAALAIPGVHLHLYGKAQPRIGRKMGHLTALADSTDEAEARVLAARRALLAR